MKYARAEIKDTLPIAALDRVAWLGNRNSDFIPDGEHAWRLWVEHALMFCAFDKRGALTGAILAFPSVTDMYCLHKVFVDPAARGKGVGSQLFSLLLADIDQHQAPCFLTVDPENNAAMRLYEKWGFTDKAFVAGYYRSHEDRYVMTRPAQP